jgi:hypothetical protein
VAVFLPRLRRADGERLRVLGRRANDRLQQTRSRIEGRAQGDVQFRI